MRHHCFRRAQTSVEIPVLTNPLKLFSIGGFYARTAGVLSSMSLLFPTRLKVVKHDFTDRSHYRSWLIESGFREKFADNRAHSHSASPFVWFSKGATTEPVRMTLKSTLEATTIRLTGVVPSFPLAKDAPDLV